MSLRRILLFVVLTGGVVLAVDFAFRSSLLRVLWPAVSSPADGAIVTPPVVLRWVGPPRMSITLISGGLREDLGLHDSPFEISADHFPRPGQYRLELISPTLGTWTATERRFLVQLPDRAEQPAPTPCPDREDEMAAMRDAITRLESDRDEARAQAARLQETVENLKGENNELTASADELHQLQLQVDAMQELLERQRQELIQQQNTLLEENRLLKSQLEAVPPCTAWGYLTYPRPQTVPATRRLVVVSDTRGHIFQNQVQCEVARRVDRGAASPCICIGQTWSR